MKQLGNLAIICAKRSDTVFILEKGIVHVLVFNEDGSDIGNYRLEWDDDQRILELCHELNHGRLARGDTP